MRPRPLFAAIAVVAVAGGGFLRVRSGLPLDALAEGLLFAGAGLAAWDRWPESRTGRFMVAYAFTVWAIHLQALHIPLLWTLAVPMALGSFVFLYTAILTFPTGRVRAPVERVIVGIAIFNLLWQTGITTLLDPRALGCTDCPPGLNLLLVRSDPKLFVGLAQFDAWIVSAFIIPTGVIVFVRWLRATRPGRRVLGPMVLPALALVVANRVSGITEIVYFYLGRTTIFRQHPVVITLGRIEQAAVIVLPLTFLLGLARARLRHTRVSKLVVELGNLPAPHELEGSLSRALGDPSLRVGVFDGARYVRANGEELCLPEDDSPYVATLLEREGQPLALMVHDRALLDEPGLVEATAAATRLAVENERLQAEIRAQLEEVRASRQRIVAAQDEERRRVERNLHDGAQQRLLRLSMALQVAESRLPTDPDPALRTSLQVAAEELRAALRELRELAQGIHPAVLTQRGLGAAIRSLAETALVPVVIEEVPEGRFAADTEAAAFYVVSEALANVAKHARASHAVVAARVREGVLEIEVRDDGVGGAAPEGGSGLRGLADRVEALDGELAVRSGADGTTLMARIALDRDAIVRGEA
jgi:signal transduction histidine kinase